MVIIGHYVEPLSTLIHRFKFQKQFWLDRTLARLLYLAIRNARRTHGLMIPDVIIPVPLHHFRIDRTLARLMYLAVRDAKRNHQLMLPEVIIPVPLYHFRQWQRGYNQADLLTRQLSRWLNIPNANQVVKRVKHTHTQRGLTAKGRRHNLKNAFALTVEKKDFPYRRVALVDDVITTGSTLNEISKLLRKLGVEEIQVWGLARA